MKIRIPQQFRTISGRTRSNRPTQIVAAVIAVVGLASVLPASATPVSAPTEQWAKGRIIVMPRAGLPAQALANIVGTVGGKARKVGQSDLHIVDLPQGASEAAAVERLSHNPHIMFAELDRRVSAKFTPNDTYFGSEWHLAKVGASTAWDTTQGQGITIAILDSGVDGAHPDLIPNLVAGYNTYDSNTNTADVCGHGTAVAGTAAAASNNGTGVASIAGQAKIMPVRIAYYDSTASQCYGYYSTISSGLTYAADHGARIANVSYGGVSSSSAIQSAAQYMKNKGGLVFVSAGNSGANDNAVATTSMIPVSATDENDNLYYWSSYGSDVAMSAPGTVWTTSQGGIYQQWQGTSFSSPLTAGVGALMMAANPALDGASVEKLLYSTATDLGAAGRDIYFGYGRVNAAAAVQAAVAAKVTVDTTPPAASISAPLGSSTVSGIVPVDISASDNVGVTRVELSVNGTVVATATASPYAVSWDSSGVPNGSATLVAFAYDAAGNSAASSAVVINVANNTLAVAKDTTPPVVAIVNPVAGAVAGSVSVNTNASDNSGAAGISQSLYIDGTLKARGTGGTLSYSWNTRKVVAGIHTIQVVAKDVAGNASSASVQVTK